MEKREDFLLELEKYVRKVVVRSQLPYYWPWVGIILLVLTLLTSALSGKDSVVSADTLREVIEKSARKGDYSTAKALLIKSQFAGIESDVLGANADLVDVVYPEQKVLRRIAELEAMLISYPGSREIFLELSDLYSKINEAQKSSEYREKARVLDPNGSEF